MFCILFTLTGAQWPVAARAQAPITAPVTATSRPIARPTACSNRFIVFDLDHTTATQDGRIQMFEANGSGLAAGDLDNDGDLDLVLGNLDAPNTILWNEGRNAAGAPFFRTERFGDENTRAITLVDVDADGALDIVLTRNIGALAYWRNQGPSPEDGNAESRTTFKRITLPGVGKPAYSLAWGDLDADGDLDLVTATYDAGMLTELGNEYLLANNGGIFVYTNNEGRFHPQQLSNEAQGLALFLFDADRDGRLDIVVGNDFNLPDMAWRNTPGGWEWEKPFAATPHSTMSIDVGDVHNDGRPELMATDMKPYAPEEVTVATAWAPLMAGMLPMVMEPNDIQTMENVLLVRDDSDMYYNVSEAVGVDATGWSWSARFGDLDLDGMLDLYVVNGFIEERLLSHLPGNELVETNQAFRNDGTGEFEEMAAWGLESTRSGRSMLMADMDNDGDLDIVVNNLRAAAQYFENDLCTEGSALGFALQQPGLQNRNAIGAQIILKTSAGTMMRDVRVSSAYLTAEPPLVHFGLAPSTQIRSATVIWPDGARSALSIPAPNTFITVTRTE
jgi:hypothetical protein